MTSLTSFYIFGISIFAFTAITSSYIPFFAGCITFRKHTSELRLLFYFIIIGLIVDLILLYIYYNEKSNLWMFHIFTLIEFLFLNFIFYIWHQNKIMKLGIRWSIIFFVLFWIVSKFSLENFSDFDDITSSFSSLLLTGSAMGTLFFLVRETEHNLLEDPIFWISLAVLVSYTAAFFILSLSNSFDNWNYHNILSIIGNLLYTGGFLSIILHKSSGHSLLEPQ